MNVPTPKSVAPLMLACAITSGAFAAESDEFLLIDGSLHTHAVRVVEINERGMAYLDANDELHPAALDDSIALIHVTATNAVRAPLPPDPMPLPPGTSAGGAPGLLTLSDGQRLPGTLAERARARDDVLGWSHDWLGRIDVPLDRIAAVTFRTREPVPVTEDEDVIVLGNGDRVHGLVTSIGDPIRVEVTLDDASQEIEIPLSRAAAVALVAPPQRPSGRRIWFRDGTMIDSEMFRVADDGFVRLSTTLTPRSAVPAQVRLVDVSAILFDSRRLLPLGSLVPSQIERTTPRYVLPEPRAIDDDAPLDLTRIEYRGPIVVRYALPPGCRRFAAIAGMPAVARQWGDFDLIIRDDDDVVYRARLNDRNPGDSINVAIQGTELTIELTAGANGPIHDHLVLSRAMLLVDP